MHCFSLWSHLVFEFELRVDACFSLSQSYNKKLESSDIPASDYITIKTMRDFIRKVTAVQRQSYEELNWLDLD